MPAQLVAVGQGTQPLPGARPTGGSLGNKHANVSLLLPFISCCRLFLMASRWLKAKGSQRVPENLTDDIPIDPTSWGTEQSGEGQRTEQGCRFLHLTLIPSLILFVANLLSSAVRQQLDGLGAQKKKIQIFPHNKTGHISPWQRTRVAQALEQNSLVQSLHCHILAMPSARVQLMVNSGVRIATCLSWWQSPMFLSCL